MVPVHAAQLSTDARGAIPHDVQQLVVIDYRAMQNSTAAMNLRNRVMPPELKQFDEALSKFTLKPVLASGKPSPNAGEPIDQDVDELAFALFRPTPGSDALQTVGIAQGQFPAADILASFKAQKIKPTMVRTNSIYPMSKTGMVLCFVDPSTMVFGSKDSVTKALDARDGMAPEHADQQSDDGSDAERGLELAVEHSGQQGHADDDEATAGRGGIGDRFRHREAAAGGFVVLEWTLQRGVRFDLTISDRRFVRGGHDFVAAVGGGDAEEDDGIGHGEAGAERDVDRLEFRKAGGSFCSVGYGVQRAAAIAAVPDDGALETGNRDNRE